MDKTPVVMIIYRRPHLTKMVIDAVAKYEPEQLFVIADGPKLGADEESVVLETRALFDQLPWDCEVTRIFSSTNLGLRNRVLSGLDDVFQRVSRAIILEDDCLPDLDFFYYASDLLERYADEESIALISGNNFAPNPKLKTSYYFSKHAYIWGWATWSSAWRSFRQNRVLKDLTEVEISEVTKSIPGLLKRRKFASLLRNMSNLDSWALEFGAWCYLNHKSIAQPKVNLVANLGFGAESTHTKFESYADQVPIGSLSFPLIHPKSVEHDLSNMNRESRLKLWRWIYYPVLHPVSFSLRVWRFLRVHEPGKPGK